MFDPNLILRPSTVLRAVSSTEVLGHLCRSNIISAFRFPCLSLGLFPSLAEAVWPSEQADAMKRNCRSPTDFSGQFVISRIVKTLCQLSRPLHRPVVINFVALSVTVFSGLI